MNEFLAEDIGAASVRRTLGNECGVARLLLLRVGGAIDESGHVAVFAVIEARYFERQLAALAQGVMHAKTKIKIRVGPGSMNPDQQIPLGGWRGKSRGAGDGREILHREIRTGQCAQQRAAKGEDALRLCRLARRRARRCDRGPHLFHIGAPVFQRHIELAVFRENT